MKKKRRFPLPFAIILPLFAAILLGEVGLYLGAYFVLNETITETAHADDTQDLYLMNNALAENNYSALGYATVPAIHAYETNKPAEPFVPGSQEEADYKSIITKSLMGQLYEYVKRQIELYTTDYVAIYYEDVASDRMVLVCSSSSELEDARSPSAKDGLYLGAFVQRDTIFKDRISFYGYTMKNPGLGKVFASGVFLGEVNHPTQAEEYGGPYRMWLVRQTIYNDVYASIPLFTRSFAIFAIMILAALLAVAYVTVYFVVLRPIKRLSKAGGKYISNLHSGEIRSVFSLTDPKTITNEMSDLNDAFYFTQEAIDEYTKKIRDSAAYEEKINADLRLAERIQLSMVPSLPLIGKDYKACGFMLPAKEVGGDLYDYFKIDEDRIGFFIGDVSGKGVPASLFMAKTQTMLRLLAASLDIKKVNNLLCQGNEEMLFVTAFIGVFNLKSGLLRYVNCGHEPVFLYHDGKYAALEENSNLALGCLEDIEFPIQEARLKRGDRLFLYTDGISEAMDEEGNLFGKTRILDTLNTMPELSNETQIEMMKQAIADFVKQAEQSDDMCMLSLDYVKDSLLEFEPSLDGLNSVPPFVDEFLTDEDPALLSSIQIILDELCSNVIRYGQVGNSKIKLCLRDDGKAIYGTIVDKGIPFDPTQEAPEHDEERIGGLGIIMVKEMSDEFHYKRIRDYNVLRFVKKR